MRGVALAGGFKFSWHTREMASNLRRTDDLHRLKVRELVLQDKGGKYPTDGGIPYISNTTGLVAVSSGATVDDAGNMITDTLVVGNEDNIGNSLEVNGNASVLGPGASRGILSTDYLNLVSHDPPNLNTSLLVQNNSLYWQNVAGQMQDVFGAAKQLIPDVSLTQLDSAPGVTSLSTVITQLNTLIKALSDHHVCVTYTPLAPVRMPIQTAQAVLFRTYPTPPTPTTTPTLVNTVTITFDNASSPVELDTIVSKLDSAFTANGMPLSATISGGQVTLTPLSGYSFDWRDGGSPGSGFRFSSHIGFDGFTTGQTYPISPATSISGTTLSGTVSQPSVPSAPSVPTLGGTTSTSITVSVTPGGSGETAILYLDDKSVLAIGITTSWTYTFTGLTPKTKYKIKATYANKYDEGGFSGELIAETLSLSPTALNLFDPAYSQYVTATPYTGGIANGVYIPVLKITPGFWPAALTQVSQIQYISLNFWSQINVGNYYDSDARLVLNLTQSPSTETPIFYSYRNRITVPSDPSNTYNWVGSPDQGPSPGPSLVANAPEIISEQGILRRIFSDGIDLTTIDKTKVLQFCWYCGYPATYINNCIMTAFTIYYII